MYEIILTVVMSMLDIPGYRYDTERSFPIKRAVFANFFRFCQPKRVPAPNTTGENRPGSGGPSTLSLRSFVNIGRGQVLDDRSAADLSSTECNIVLHFPVNFEYADKIITEFNEKVAHTMQPFSR